MGQRAAKEISVKEGVPSPSGNGLPSCLSEPVEQIGDPLQLWYGLVSLHRNPMGTHKIVSSSAWEFEVSQTVPASTIRLDGIEPGSDEDVDITLRHFPDKRSRAMRTLMIFKGVLIARYFWQVHDFPTRMEFWREKPGRRKANETIRSHVDSLLNYIVSRTTVASAAQFQKEGDDTDGGATGGDAEAEDRPAAASSAVAVHQDVESLVWPGQKSVMSETLPDHVEFEQLWAEALDIIKYRPKDAIPGLKDTLITSHAEAADTDVAPITVTYLIDGEVAGTGSDCELVRRIWPYRGREEIEVEDWGKQKAPHGAPSRVTFHFHQDPLRVEAWGEQPGRREANRALADICQAVVNQIINKQKDNPKTQGSR